MKLDGRVALVTGAGIRLGREIALALAGEGMHVAVHYAHSEEQARSTADAIRKQGAKAETFAADLEQAGEAEALVEAVAKRMGALDVLVNSAAIMVREAVGSVTYESWDRTMNLNLRAPFFLSQAAAALIRGRKDGKGGVIVNIADLAAFETWPNYVPHSISKAGLVQMTRAMAHALAPAIRVNAIAPGAVLLPEDWPAEAAERLKKTTPLGSLGEPKDVTEALLFLLRSDYITGETIIVDGGRHVRR